MSKRKHEEASPDSREFANPYPQFQADSPSNVVCSGKITDSFSQAVSAAVVRLISQMESGLRQNCDENDQSVYTGVTGIALLYLRLHQVYTREEYLDKCRELIQRILKSLKGRRFTFMCGDAGPLAVGAVLYHRMGQEKAVQDCVKRLQELHKSVLDPGLPNELLYGRVGYLYALLYVQRELGEGYVDMDLVDKVCQRILDSGQRLARRERLSSPLMFEWHDKKYIGAAHGVTGILTLLMQASCPSVTENLHSLIKPTVDYVLGLRFPSGNFPSSLGNQSDKLIHWCHGAPGVIHMLLQAYKVFGEDKYLAAARDCGRVIWSRGILRKGYGLCHGTAGNAYSFLALYQATKDAKYLYYACKFAEWCMDYGKHGCRTADRPYSLMEGMAGTVCFLSDLLNPPEARFPGLYVT